MKHQPISAGITFTNPHQGLWLISLYGRRVGTVEGNSVIGFTARDKASAKSAMQAWVS
jgi:hypothetical protein